jgi:UDP-N-acetylglucosamine 2-epimerase (non-hydrolysing)/GDP/UDP-N,N'-diacetylbacillosamine 2-epimerase (hydrolysing)
MAERSICIITTSRADYGNLRSLIRAVLADPDLELRLLVSGSHLFPDHGGTVSEIEADGVPIWQRVPIHVAGGDEQAALATIGVAIPSMAAVLGAERPDVIVVLGDRYEMIAGGLVALLLRIPLAHLHGGEVTAGALDESIRHSLTKMATYHFVATHEYADNVEQLGEDPQRVFTVGAPGLDGIAAVATIERAELFRRLGLAPDRPTAIVTFHPVTRGARCDVVSQANALLSALERTEVQAIFTAANADPYGSLINEQFTAAAAQQPQRYRFVTSLGQELYTNCLRHLDLMVGNSSSGIIEAPSFGLPVVNIGDRQEGRVVAANVITVECTVDDIAAAIHRALGGEFRALAARTVNPYAPHGSGGIGMQIKTLLKSLPLGPDVTKKRFRRMRHHA